MTLSSEGPSNVALVVFASGSAEENEEEISHNKKQQQEPAAAQQQRPSTSTLPHQRPNPYLPSNIQKKRMGLKSQHAVSAIKACKKKGSSFSWSKSKEGNAMNKASQQSQTCRVCQAKALNRKIPKRAHHPNCKHNRAFKNKSRKAPAQQQQAPAVTAGATAYSFATQPSRGTGIKDGPDGGMNQMSPLVTHQSANHSLLTAPAPGAGALGVVLADEATTLGTAQGSGVIPSVSDLDPPVPLPLGQALRNELERRLGVLRLPVAPQPESAAATQEKDALATLVAARAKGVPIGVQLLFDYIHNKVTIKRRSKNSVDDVGSLYSSSLTNEQQEAMINRRIFFNDQQCFFTFPPDPSLHPLAEYHFIEGFSIFMLDLEILLLQTATSGTSHSVSNIVLRCSACQGCLHRDRTNWSKRKTLFPVLEQNGLFSFGSVMTYKCVSCKATYAANAGSLLQQIPPHIRRAYPVEPRFALSGFHFHLSKDVTCNLRGAMLTQGSGENESKLLYRKSREKFTEAVATFLSKLPDATADLPRQFLQNFPISYKDWCRSPPGGDQLRSYYCQGEQSCDTIYGYSNKDRYVREIQSVGASPDENVTAVVIDWTFQALKTYRGLGTQGGKCMFTMKVVGDRGKRTAGVAVVPNTSAASISHFMINMITKREGLKKQVSLIFTDEWPSASAFWKDIFGHHIVGRLGLFHAIKRITDTVERGEDWEFFNGLLYDLRLCFYGYDSDDMGNVVAALRAGTMTRDKHQYSAKEIDVFKKTPEWNRRFSSHIRKNIYNGPLISQKLEEFRLKYQNLRDDNGKQRFTKATSKAIDDLLGKVHHVGDLPDKFSPYRVISAGSNSTHGLPKYESLRPESALEKFHHILAHFGNIGMSRDLADTILLRGIAEDNVRIEHQQRPKNPDVPSRFEDEPEYFDQSELKWLNSLGEQKGYLEIFKNACEPPLDNGEVFLSEYLVQEMKRKKKGSINTKSNKCNCVQCIGFSFPLVCSVSVPVPREQAVAPATTTTGQVGPLGPSVRGSLEIANSTRQNHRVLANPSLQQVPQMSHLFPVSTLPTNPWLGVRTGLLLPPPDIKERCYMHPPFVCAERWAWQCLRDAGGTGQRLGAPRHDRHCPRRCTPSIYSPFT